MSWPSLMSGRNVFIAVGIYILGLISIGSLSGENAGSSMLSQKAGGSEPTVHKQYLHGGSSQSSSEDDFFYGDDDDDHFDNYYDVDAPHFHPSAHYSPPHRTKEARRDQIDYLPGIHEHSIPNFDHFSGYLTVNEERTRHVFYLYVESQRDPDNDPVVLWTNGGPGCSGLLGWGTEHGPFFISKNGSLHKNPYSWNKLANMLYIEQPAGVGLGYCDRAEDYKTDDAQAAADNYRLILDFLKKFPERQSNPFYIASESYGGHYMPQLALEILDNDPHGEKINFQGLLVGNPYVDPYSNAVTQFESYYSHGLLSKPLFDEWSVACRDPNLYESDKCEEITDDFFRQFGPGINPYALDYPVCTQQIKEGEEGEEELYDEADYLEEYMETHQAEQQQTSQTNIQGEDSVIHKLLQLRLASVGRPLLSKRHAYGGYNTEEAADYTTGSTGEMVDPEDDAPKLAASAQLKTFLNTTKTSPPFLPEHDKYKPCAQEYLEKYLNRHDVRKALHVNPKRITAAWLACGGVEYSTADVDTPTTHLYRELVRRAKAGEHTLQMLIFSGDDDSICSTAGTQAWIWNQIGSDPVNDRKIWKAWKVRGQTAGYVTHFNVTSDVPKENIRADHVRRLLKDAPKEASFIFATVHGAGHEVPAYRPLEALALFDRFMNRDW